MGQQLSCLIVEDEPLAAGILADYVRQVPWLEFVGRCPDAWAAGEALRVQTVDLMFLDINLPGLKGLDFLRSLQQPPQVILTTAYHEFALESYEVGVVDYLLKPIDFERFLKAIQKVKLAKSPVDQASQARPFRFYNANKKMVRIWLDEILYVESQKEYLRFNLMDGKSLVTKMTLSELEQSLDGMGFVRIHRSFLVGFRHIEAYSATEITVAGQELVIGRQYRDAVQLQIGQF